MQYLLCYKIKGLLIGCFLLPVIAFSQLREELNLPDHDEQLFHFGINLGVNRAYYHFSNNPLFIQRDSILSVESLQSNGINLAWLVNMRLGDHFDLSTYPLDLIFTEKAFQYRLKYPEPFSTEGTLVTRKIQGITLTLPMQIKFSSDRINNFKVYILGGGKVEYDFAANKGDKNAEKLMKLEKLDYGIEAGIGFHFYFPVFVLSPELKLGWGLKNVHSRDPNLKYSNVIDEIKSRTINLSFIIE